MHAGSWTLSPAFDLNPNPAPGPKQLSNTIDGYDTAASIDTLVTVAGFFRLTEGDTASALANVLAATSRWREVAATHDLPEAEISEMAGAFEHPQTEAAQAVAAT